MSGDFNSGDSFDVVARGHELARIKLEKPDDLIFTPQLVSAGAGYLLNAILYNEAQNNDSPVNREGKIAIRDVRFLIGAEKSHNAAFIEKILGELMNIKLKWGELLPPDELGSGDRLNVMVTFLQKAAYRSTSTNEIDPERGFITYQLSDPIFDLIRQKRAATGLAVLMQREFDKPYSYKLYELFSSLLKRQPTETAIEVIYELGFIRQLLGVDGYPVFGDFNKYVLKPNVEEVNQKAEFTLTMTQLRAGKAVHAIKFTATRKPHYQYAFSLDTSDKLPKLLEQALAAKRDSAEREHVLKRLADYKIAKKVAVDLLDERGVDEIERIVAAVDADINAGFKPRSRTAYMRSCLMGDSVPGQYAAERRWLDPEAEKLFIRLVKEFGLTEAKARQLCQDHPAEQVGSALYYVEQRRLAGKTIGKGYVVKAIEEDWGAELRHQAAQDQQDQEHRQAEMARLEGQIAHQRAAFEALSEDEQAALRVAFLDKPPPGWGRNAQEQFREQGFDGPITSRAFYPWVAARLRARKKA